MVRPRRIAAAQRHLVVRRSHRPDAGCAGAPLVASAIDFVLEGLYAQKKISRSEERGYSSAEAAPRRSSRRDEVSLDDEIRIPNSKKKYYN